MKRSTNTSKTGSSGWGRRGIVFNADGGLPCHDSIKAKMMSVRGRRYEKPARNEWPTFSFDDYEWILFRLFLGRSSNMLLLVHFEPVVRSSRHNWSWQRFCLSLHWAVVWNLTTITGANWLIGSLELVRRGWYKNNQRWKFREGRLMRDGLGWRDGGQIRLFWRSRRTSTVIFSDRGAVKYDDNPCTAQKAFIDLVEKPIGPELGQIPGLTLLSWYVQEHKSSKDLHCYLAWGLINSICRSLHAAC